ncbi:hypothetical protein HanIR_Chr12g0601491 [Helianthus annuus]|nr:hypothetical protein HanIR_Chr12g0601491 [Helianthus annuus]
MRTEEVSNELDTLKRTGSKFHANWGHFMRTGGMFHTNWTQTMRTDEDLTRSDMFLSKLIKF